MKRLFLLLVIFLSVGFHSAVLSATTDKPKSVPTNIKMDASSAAHHSGNETIRYTIVEDIYPVLFRDMNGDISGYLSDISKRVEERSDLRFEYVPVLDGKTPVEMLIDGDVDFLPSFAADARDFGRGHISQPLSSIRYFSVRYHHQIFNSKALIGVLLPDTAGYTHAKNAVFGENTRMYTSIRSVLSDLKEGKLKSVYVREDVLDYLIANDDENQLAIDRNKFKVLDVTMTVKEEHQELSDLIYNIVTHINPQEIRRLQNGYSPFNLTYGYEKSLVIIGLYVLCGIVVLVAFIGYLWNKNLKLKVSLKVKEAQRTKDDLAFLQNIINGLPNQIFIHDANHKLLLSNCRQVNNGTCKHCELSLLGQRNTKVIENSVELSRVLQGGETIRRDVDVNVCGAGLKTIDYFRTRIVGPGGKNEFVLTVVNDVTVQKEQERALTHAKDTAQQAVQSRERFLASMSHELRTPISGMAGLLEMLKMRTQDEDTLMMLNNVIASTRHLHLLVNDILDFSKLEAQQLELDLRDCHLLQEAGELLRIHCASAQAKALDFEVNWQPTSIKVVRIDPLRCSQIINNLLSNAIKFTDQGKVSVDIKLDEKQIYFSVSDTGVGMNKELIKTVFNPFFQADSTIARRYGGTGLGLSIVNHLIEVMNGCIDIKSEPGKGTTVEFAIPHQVVRHYGSSKKKVNAVYHGTNPQVAEWIDFWSNHSECGDRPIDSIEHAVHVFDEIQLDGSLCEDQSTVIIKHRMQNFRSREGNCVCISDSPLFADLLFDAVVGKTKDVVIDDENERAELSGRVLVAEDNPINQLVFQKQFGELGIDVDIVENGQLALERLLHDPTGYDLLLTDCHMPVLDGYELVNRVRLLSQFNHMALIGCTAEDSRVATEKAMNSGFDAVLYKPYGINRLYTLLSEYLMPKPKVSELWLTKYDHSDALILSQVYVDTMDKDLALLIEHRDDRKKLREVVHRIKGGAGTIGELNIHQRAFELENKMHHSEGNLAEIFDGLVVDITTSIEQTQVWINENPE